MVEDMPRPRPPHLHKEVTRHGQTVWYVRINKGPRIRLWAEYGSEEFKQQYRAAVAGDHPARDAKARPDRPANGTLEWALSLYRQSIQWNGLAPSTRRQRDNIFKHVVANAGTKLITSITKKIIFNAYQSHASTPHAARNFLDAMRGLMQWAVAADILKTDPTAEIKASKPQSDGFLPWSSEDLQAFYKRWKLGTRERLACDVLYYTGLRRGDAAVFGRQHVNKDTNVAKIQTEKTGQWAYFLMEPELLESIAACPGGDMTYICGERGRPMVKESFGNWFSAAAREAGVRKSAHGLRKSGATRDAERGFTEAELQAKYAWESLAMASRYTRAVNRERLAVQAAKRAHRQEATADKKAAV